MTPHPLLDTLREATRDQHDDIESLLRLMEPLARERYAAIVSGFHAFLGCWEPRIQAALPVALHDWWRPRQRQGFAAQDLQHLGVGAAPGTARVAREAVDDLPLHTPAHAFGSMYVIEGSALGGQVIAPKLQRELGVLPGSGASYFHGFGRDTGGMWREFRDVLSREVGQRDAEREAGEACEAARGTFSALMTVFRTLPP